MTERENAPQDEAQDMAETSAQTPTETPVAKDDEQEYVVLTEEQIAARNRRNRAIALGLLAFIGLIFVTTVLRLSYNYNHGG